MLEAVRARIRRWRMKTLNRSRPMGDGKHCPACGVDIGVWPVFSAGLPNRLRCPRCKARLAYRRTGLLWLVILPVLAAVVVVSYHVASAFDPQSPQWPLVFVGVMLASWVPVELLSAWYLRAYKVLEDRSSKPPPSEGAPPDEGAAANRGPTS
jgi:uncharacterized protein (DUF983 family)